MKKFIVLMIVFSISVQGCTARKSENTGKRYEYDSLVGVVTALNSRIKSLRSEERAQERTAGDRTKGLGDNPGYTGNWRIQPVKDDYGETTGRYFVMAECTGEIWSNSSSIPSSVKIRLCLDQSNVWMQMFEYSGRIPLSGKGIMLIRIKDRNNSESLITSFVSARGIIEIKGDDASRFRKILLSGGKVMFIAYCPADSFSDKQYKFTFENLDFLYKALTNMDNV